MITKSFLLALDFDGVIWDSVDEAFYTGYLAFRSLEGEIELDYELLKEQFRQGRFLVKAANDVYIIFHLLKENPEMDFSTFSIDEFHSLRDVLSGRTDKRWKNKNDKFCYTQQS